jgi:hypothetical protein
MKGSPLQKLEQHDEEIQQNMLPHWQTTPMNTNTCH